MTLFLTPEPMFFCDVAHAWLRVTHEQVFAAGIATAISTYSYIDATYVYLEEDRDAMLYIEAANLGGRDVASHEEVHSRVRDLLPYTEEGLNLGEAVAH